MKFSPLILLSCFVSPLEHLIILQVKQMEMQAEELENN